MRVKVTPATSHYDCPDLAVVGFCNVADMARVTGDLVQEALNKFAADRIAKRGAREADDVLSALELYHFKVEFKS